MRCQTCPPFSPPPDSRHGRRFATRTTRSKPFPALPEEGSPRHAVEHRAQYRARFYGGSSSLFPPAAFRKFRHPGTNPVRPSQRRPLPSQRTVRSSRRRTTANTPATGCKRMQPFKIIVPYRHGSQSVRHGTPPYEPGELLSSISRPGTLPPRHSCPGSRSERKAFA